MARDFVEFPSQVYEHWLETPEILGRFAVHAETGAPMPEDLVRRLLVARQFNQGHATVEFTASALVDLNLHLEKALRRDRHHRLRAERASNRLGMPAAITTRHRTPHFQHVFAGSGYSAGYYSYLWSETLDADGFEAFEESGDIFDPALAGRLHDYVLCCRQSPRAGRRLCGLPRTRAAARAAAAQARPVGGGIGARARRAAGSHR